MSFPTSAYLRKATARAKSDVANKLVSMFLHDLSRRICVRLTMSVSDAAYADAVADTFGTNCCYCGKPLELDRAAVEHLEGMNRFRLGLHIPGNVIVACRRCNGEKRRDDQLNDLILATSGWESFLWHDSTCCKTTCKTCSYWAAVWPNPIKRAENIKNAREKIAFFRSRYTESLKWSESARNSLRATVDSLYRECQEFATVQIRRTVEEAFVSLSGEVSQPSTQQIGIGVTAAGQ